MGRRRRSLARGLSLPRRDAPGLCEVSSCCSPPARGAERRKALVRNAAPMAALRLGQSLHRKGLPVHDADRRALRRSTTVFARPWPHSLSGRAFLPGLLTCSPGSPAGSLRTGHLVPVGRGPRRPGSPVVSRTRRQTVPASASGNHPDGAPQQAGENKHITELMPVNPRPPRRMKCSARLYRSAILSMAGRTRTRHTCANGRLRQPAGIALVVRRQHEIFAAFARIGPGSPTSPLHMRRTNFSCHPPTLALMPAALSMYSAAVSHSIGPWSNRVRSRATSKASGPGRNAVRFSSASLRGFRVSHAAFPSFHRRCAIQSSPRRRTAASADALLVRR